MHLSPPAAWAAVPSKAVVLLLLTFCLLLLPLWESVIVLCFVVRYFMSILVLQSSLWGEGGLVAFLNLSSWCLVVVGRLFLALLRGCLRVVVFPGHTRVPTSSGNHGKPGKSLKKFHAWKNHGI